MYIITILSILNTRESERGCTLDFFKVFSLPVTLFLESMSWFNPSFAVPWLLLHNDLIFPSTTPGHRDFPSQEEAIHATPVVGLSLIITGKQSPYSVTWLSILLEVVNADFQLNVTWQGGGIVVRDWLWRGCSSPRRSLGNERAPEDLRVQEEPLPLIRRRWTTCCSNFTS